MAVSPVIEPIDEGSYEPELQACREPAEDQARRPKGQRRRVPSWNNPQGQRAPRTRTAFEPGWPAGTEDVTRRRPDESGPGGLCDLPTTSAE